MKAYSYDLRSRIYNYSLTHTIRETAQVFNVSPNTVNLLRKLFIETGDLHPRVSSFDYPHLITPEGEIYLGLLLASEVDLTLEELCDRYEKAYGVRVSIGTMYNTLERLNITRKKKTFSDPKKNTIENQLKKEIYDKKIAEIEPENRFYIDETGTCLNMAPLYGRSFKNERCYDQRPTNQGTRVNSIAILTTDGIKAHYDYTESLTSELFIIYLTIFVLPIMTGGQTLILDNHPVHTSNMVKDFFNQHNIQFLYLPPYSPELNPIEEAFSKFKQYIKKQKPRVVDKLLEVIKDAFDTITLSNIKGYFNHAAQF
jgi:transposase